MPFFSHLTLNGVSPLITEQVIEARSPTFRDRMVEWKGFILGGTERQNYFFRSTQWCSNEFEDDFSAEASFFFARSISC